MSGEQLTVLKEQARALPPYPQDGYVADVGDYVIVKLGEESLFLAS